jgi:uroporphyrin-III C-methyltransferase
MQGKVYLVGAGPGHPELLTLKAAELIRNGDVIVYDRLVQEEVLAMAKPSAERLYMGKPVGKHDSRQDEVNELLVRKAREGRMVVRLKGGDPFLFGRGGEEAEFLAEHGVPFEVIPGVCSALSAPLSAGIPVTHRDAASAVAIVTGHNATGAEDRLDWNALAHVDTVVFLMAVHNCGKIARRLIECGRSPLTAAAMIQMAFWHGERVVTGTLEDIAERVRAAGIEAPATFVVGEVVRLREKLECAQRDLRPRSDSSTRFQPAPAPDQLLRIASGGIGAQVFGWALEIKLFDSLDEPITAYELSNALCLNAEGMNEILRALVALGLLESRPEGYRNLELASRYLVSTAPLSLRDWLLYNCSQLVQWRAIAEFARHGLVSTEAARKAELHRTACEAAARFAAPTVIERLVEANFWPVPSEVASPHPVGSDGVLVIGWGGAAHAEALRRRWSKIRVVTCSPLSGDELPRDHGCELVILSGVLDCGDPAKVEQILDFATNVGSNVRLLLHDDVLPVGTLPAPEVALASLARRIMNHGYQVWSTERLAALLERRGFVLVKSDVVLAGHAVVFSERVQSGMALARSGGPPQTRGNTDQARTPESELARTAKATG